MGHYTVYRELLSSLARQYRKHGKDARHIAGELGALARKTEGFNLIRGV